MRPILISLLLLSLLAGVSACEQSFETPVQLAEGTYSGHFIRSSPAAKYAAAEVTLVLKDGRFSGSSNISRYPAICTGTYQIKGTTIEFQNECFFTADFDWSLILSGTFHLSASDGDIVLFREFGEGVMDTYRLKK
ncbi:hypothetical protein [Cesiribacter andamanensis]|nr:hypothetical protein [Cesiribacter andamanensis]